MTAQGRRQSLRSEPTVEILQLNAPRDKVRVSIARLLYVAASIAALASALTSTAHARATESASEGTPTGPSSEQEGGHQDIVVVAERSEQSSIDRTTYIVKDNAEARASSALDLLGRVPSVDVSPSGAVRLIGRSGVTILIDGQDVPNANAFLRAMQGSEVAKIEVVTNPSAQFSARGTGGIINIITRRSSGAGLGGSVMAKAGTLGSYELRSSPSWTQGKVSLSGSIGITRGEAKSEIVEERVSVESGEESSRFESEDGRSETDSVNASFRAAVEIAPKQTISLDGLAFDSEGGSFTESDIVEDEVRSEERSSSTSDVSARRIGVNYRREGSRPGGQTSLSASYASYGFSARRQSATGADGGSSVFRLSTDASMQDAIVKADHVRPAGERRLSIGGQFQHHAEDHLQQVSMSMPPAAPVATADEFAGSWAEAEAYLTYQLPFQGSMILAGARIGSRWHDIAGTPGDPAGSTHVFPSLHVERKLGEWLTANLSYSSRIAWPNLALLDPRLRFSDPTTARAGNPHLRPEKTHSVELKLTAKTGRHEADLTSYYQRTRDLLSDLVELEGDVLVSQPVNLGRRASLGTNLNLRGPLARGLRYRVTGYLAHDKFDEPDLSDIDRAGTRYGASLELDYRDGAEGRAGADQIRLAARYTGPSEDGLSRTSSTVSADASWSHAITNRLSAVLTASHFLRSSRTTYFGEDVIIRSSFRPTGPTINLALTYGLSPSGS